MSSRARGGGAELDLELNLSPPTVNSITESPTESLNTSPTSSSCLSLDLDSDSDKLSSLAYCSDSSSAVTPMVLVGCQRCLMYVMISKEVCLKCPKCKSTDLLDILHGKPKAVDDPKLDKKVS
ncbi:hypothetical protein ACJRO7_007730 [Eucalyptus globulus]|uniref:GIR1-like zinc ribbon domain-containing protein n=1 Tax=Eucalyptus globulus TaxID=34317 RepID=A0ABD3IM39_EUCGL